jgi:hypothetical protein
MVSFFLKKIHTTRTRTMDVETFVESGYRELDRYLYRVSEEEFDGFDVRYYFSDEKLDERPERNMGKYKYTYKFYFFFYVDASAGKIDIVVYFKDSNVRQAMGNLDQEEFIRDLVDLLKGYIDDDKSCLLYTSPSPRD